MIRVGQRLQEERLRQGLSIAEVAKATKIRPQFLSAIEKGDYHSLPSSAYVQGFIRNYAEYLGLPVKNILALFRREFDEREYIRVLPESFTKQKGTFSGFRFGPMAIFLSVVILFVLGYIGFQYRSAFFDPKLEITSPRENTVVVAQVIPVIGKTDDSVTVSINDEPVYVEKDGTFNKDITVFTGSNTITIIASNNFGKKTTIVRHITARGN